MVCMIYENYKVKIIKFESGLILYIFLVIVRVKDICVIIFYIYVG